jgi:hypothetical protein
MLKLHSKLRAAQSDVFMALYSLGRAFFEAFVEPGADFV